MTYKFYLILEYKACLDTDIFKPVNDCMFTARTDKC